MKPDFLQRLTVLDSRQLLAFVLVGRTLSFTQAAKQLHVTQSAVSHAIKTLEQDVEQRLLDRNGKQLRVTPAGEHLLHYAEKVLSLMNEARVALARRESWQANGLRVAAEESFCARLLPGFLRTFQRKFPGGQISVRMGETHNCVEWLQQNLVDVAIAIAPGRLEAVEVTSLFTDEVQWVVGPRHPWVKTGVATLGAAAEENFICTSLNSYPVRLLKSHLERENLRLRLVQEVASLEAVVEMVTEGGGMTALPAWAIRKELEARTLRTIPFGRRKFRRNWALLRPLDRPPELLSENFAKLLMEIIPTITATEVVRSGILGET